MEFDQCYREWDSDFSARMFGPPQVNFNGEIMYDVGASTLDLMEYNYVYFLDNVATLDDLITGLSAISPFADDALEFARSMYLFDFAEFKLALAHERRAAAALEEKGIVEASLMPEKYGVLLYPQKLLHGAMVAPTFFVPLGVATARLIELGIDFSTPPRG